MNDRTRIDFDLDDLLHPAHAFERPSDVVNDPDLTLNEKRAILASWASDACALEAAPDLRSNPHGGTVRFDDIMDALKQLDREAAAIKHSLQPINGRKRWKGQTNRGGHSLLA